MMTTQQKTDRWIDLKKLFSGMQNQMSSQLSFNRDFINHSTSKGDSLENAWIEWLQKYLPSRYSVNKAIVIDQFGNTSDQIDVVIYDNYFTPFIFNQDGIKYIPAEGVYAVFEVKPEMNKNYIEYTGKKIASVRKLNRTTVQMINSGNVAAARPLTKIIGGILTSTNSFSHSKGNPTIQEHISNLKGLETIDLGCIADYGSFWVKYDGEENPKETDFAKRFCDYYQNRTFQELTFSKPHNSLITFFLQLTQYLKVIGTVGAIDLQAYLNTIDEKIDIQFK